MPSQYYINKIIEEFRFFDDLASEVRKALREANYQWNPIEVMPMQHQYYQNGLTMEELASLIIKRDENLKHSRNLSKFRINNKKG